MVNPNSTGIGARARVVQDEFPDERFSIGP
jgi:hypothetical protein